MSKPTPDDLPDLSNTDVEILYEIIASAQQSQDPPFRALFAAYDTVLAQYGIQPDHDQIYFRFLLRMGENKTDTKSLFEQFEALLAKLGIQLDFNDDNDKGDATTGITDKLLKTERPPTWSDPKAARMPSRRASFDSAYDTGYGRSAVQFEPAVATTTRSHSHDIAHKRHSRLPSRRSSQAVSSKARRAHSGSRGGLNAQESRSRTRKHTNYILTHERSRSRDGQESGLASFPQASAFDTSDEDSDPELIQEYSPDLSQWHDTLQKAHYRFSESQVPIDLEDFQAHRTAIQARNLIRHWRQVAGRSHDVREEMYEQARAHDRHILMRQAYDQWCSTLLRKRQIGETEKFFEHLESRASKARDLFLLTKAFTHWAQSAADEVLRTSAAKRHILRTRYFNAWQESTVINELKVRRQGLRKFLGIWSRRLEHVSGQTNAAYFSDESRLIGKCYRLWFWRFCEQRAPLWSADKLRARIFAKWLDEARNGQLDALRALRLRQATLLQSNLDSWRHRCAVAVHHDQAATTFRHRSLLKDAFGLLRKEAILAPLATRLGQAVDSRVAIDAFSLWKRRASLCLHANRTDTLRVMRNGWTTWNDRLRCTVLRKRIDDRIASEVLYEWVLSERLSLCERIAAQKLKRKSLSCWTRRFNQLCASLGQATSTLREVRNKNVLQSAFAQWSNLKLHYRQQEQRATEFRNHQLFRQTIKKWSARSATLRQLHYWADDARFFVLGTRSIKAWRTTIETTRRTKRRNAYTTLRRKVKTNLATRLLTNWRYATKASLDMRSEAEETYRQHLMQVAHTLCNGWQDQARTIAFNYDQAEALYRRHLLRTQFYCLHNRLHRIQHANTLAFNFFTETVETRAGGLLRKLNWQLFQIKRQQETAASLEERNRRKHYRNMIKYWAEKTVQRRRLSTQTRSQSQELQFEPLLVGDSESNADLDVGHTDNWAGLDERDSRYRPPYLDLASTPGYLRTPSKRTGKGRPRLSTPRTPATTQGTLFTQRLSVPSAGNRTRSTRGDFARRLRGLSQGGIEDIPETSPLRDN